MSCYPVSSLDRSIAISIQVYQEHACNVKGCLLTWCVLAYSLADILGISLAKLLVESFAHIWQRGKSRGLLVALPSLLLQTLSNCDLILGQGSLCTACESQTHRPKVHIGGPTATFLSQGKQAHTWQEGKLGCSNCSSNLQECLVGLHCACLSGPRQFKQTCTSSVIRYAVEASILYRVL